MGPPGGAPKNGGTPPDQEMLITQLPAINFCLNHDGFEYFFKPDLSSMVSGPLKKRKIADFSAQGIPRGDPPGGSPGGDHPSGSR